MRLAVAVGLPDHLLPMLPGGARMLVLPAFESAPESARRRECSPVLRALAIVSSWACETQTPEQAARGQRGISCKLLWWDYPLKIVGSDMCAAA